MDAVMTFAFFEVPSCLAPLKEEAVGFDDFRFCWKIEREILGYKGLGNGKSY